MRSAAPPPDLANERPAAEIDRDEQKFPQVVRILECSLSGRPMPLSDIRTGESAARRNLYLSYFQRLALRLAVASGLRRFTVGMQVVFGGHFNK